ncbi:Alpha-mannosyltransferase [Colletotrichum sp. SAR 10_96]|nr:Alpha-mannosyltransferase [Colletotrichum sp. SAR 10_96]
MGTDSQYIIEAINARFIMNNDLSRIDPDTPDKDDVPRMFWYPLFPQERTLRELVRRRPNSRFRVTLVCIAANYQHTYDALDVAPHYITYQQARMSHNPHYARDIERRAAASGVNLYPDTHLNCLTRPDKEPTSLAIEPEIRTFRGAFVEAHVEGIYPGELQANAASWELSICVPEGLKRRVRAGGLMLYSECDDIETWKAAISRR